MSRSEPLTNASPRPSRHRNAMRALAAVAAGLLIVASVCSTAQAADRTLSRNGRIGPLNIDSATTAKVKATFGAPKRASASVGEGGAALTVWRYDCGRGRYTRFFFDSRGRLGNVQTACHSWRTGGGTRVGMSRSEAEEREGKQATAVACGDGLSITRTGAASLFITFTAEQSPVRILALAGKHSVLGC